MTISLLLNADEILSIVTDPSIYPFTVDDSAPPACEVSVKGMLGNPGVYFLGGYIDQLLMACFLFHAHNGVLFEMHAGVLPAARGKPAIRLALDAIRWMFEHTACLKVMAIIPADNTKAMTLAKRCGFRYEGRNRKSFMRNGQLLDQHMLGMLKGELPCL